VAALTFTSHSESDWLGAYGGLGEYVSSPAGASAMPARVKPYPDQIPIRNVDLMDSKEAPFVRGDHPHPLLHCVYVTPVGGRVRLYLAQSELKEEVRRS